MDHEAELRRYLGMLASCGHDDTEGRYGSIAGMLLDKGATFTGPGEPLTDAEMMLIDVACGMWPDYAVKECYFNAQRLAYFTDQRLRYFEGYAQGLAMIPVPHAWVVTACNKVIDLTWRRFDREPFGHPNPGAWDTRFAVGTMPEEGIYLGVEIDASDALARMHLHESCIPYLDDWKGGWPLLAR